MLVLVDALWTTAWVAGHAGPLSRVLIGGPRRLARALPVQMRHRALSALGPVTLIVTVLMWMGLVWVGWALVFLADPVALVRAPGEPVASAWDVVYYAGFTVFSLGVGDVRPATPAWQMATVVAVGNGLFLVTLAVTYVLTVVSSVVSKRTLATEVMGLGGTPGEFVVALWHDREGGREASAYLAHLAESVSALAEQHLAYPILHAYHPARTLRAPSLAIVVLDEAVTIMEYGFADDARVDRLALKRLRTSIGIYLDSLGNAWIARTDEVPPPPSLRGVADAGIPVVDDAEFARRVNVLTDRRRALAGLLNGTGWAWDTIRRA